MPEDILPRWRHAVESLQSLPQAACALIGTAFLENLLGAFLKQHFVKSHTAEQILSPTGGFLGSFESRAQMAYVLGMISKSMRHNLSLIGRIRNLFAHSIDADMEFGHADISELCDQLHIHAGIKFVDINDSGYTLHLKATSDARDRFILAVAWAGCDLYKKTESEKHKEPGKDTWPMFGKSKAKRVRSSLTKKS